MSVFSGRGDRRKKSRGVIWETILFLPNLVRLLIRLTGDSRVPTAEKALLFGTIAYVVSPLDLLPDVIPFLGQVDDLYLVALVTLRLLSRTDAAVLNEHWDGPGNLSLMVDRIATAARYVLPKRISRVLLGRVVIGPRASGGLLVSPGLPAETTEPPPKK